MKKTVLKWTILVVLVAYTVGISVWAAGQHSMQACNGIEVSIAGTDGPMPLTEQGVCNEVLGHCPGLLGTPLNSIDTGELEKYLMSLNYFEEVECVATSQGKLHFFVKSMVPEARVFDSTGSYYINKDGKRVDALPDFHCDVPIITGNFNRSFRAVDVLPVVRHISSDPTLRHLVTMIKADSPDDILLSTVWKGHVVNLGDTTRLAEKFRYLEAAYRQILPVRGWETYDTIYVKFKGQIVASRADKNLIEHSVTFDEEPDPEELSLMEESRNQEQAQTGE